MHHISELLGKKITGLNKIVIAESKEQTSLTDSILLGSNSVSYQIYTNQTGIYVQTIISTNDIVIDGEYEITGVLYNAILTVEDFKVDRIELFWDKDKMYILGVVLKSREKQLFFIRLADEISCETQDSFKMKLGQSADFQTESIIE
ncbi:hypothetical protein AAEO56_01165 [Flavobacterium sp. DGU11]|uniref:Uncharacterized protein n=1 Tax=Flavobacterium arundinis TaxID=3139143 RepID=A0ABU9HRS4_9FLAO